MPTVTKNLIIINVLVFFGTLVAQRYGIDLTNYLGLHFSSPVTSIRHNFITYMFMHGGFSHIFFNMFAVFMFGTVLERTWGPKRFLFYYIVCGIGAGLIQEGVQYIKYVVDYSHYSQVDIGTGIIPMGDFLNMLTTVGASGLYMPFCSHSVCCSPTTSYSSFRCLSLSKPNTSLSVML